MRRVPLSLLLVGTLGLLLMLGAENRVLGQGVAAQKVKFQTGDGVELHGHWYASANKNPPVVLFLHALGENGNADEWRKLAKTLQKEGFAVLMFDFRGHGNSTAISDLQKFLAFNNSILKRSPLSKTRSLTGWITIRTPTPIFFRTYCGRQGLSGFEERRQ